ncbi:basic amino acid ABC transporter substrate-binding protein [Tepidibacillus fermentans]|uniref:Polar amino acid transport system substrate-binding protein n=1 Tax=Tepidibacillus fermentans TaxID=1281767 RepID=A0A4R3KJF5_9BACI|nr:basic amino acid ABC transporter substrate-binding protein [Tepidibacillus fermentans]TCS83301.1 polar amino acid transport system substrate-binding protein [Tepidibacillus fermentans]
MKSKGLKVVLLMFLFVVGSLGLIGCSSEQTGTKSQEGQKAAEEKTYVVVTNAEFPPFESTLPSGEIVGFDIDLINAIAKAENMKIKIQHQGWEAMLKAVETGTADIGASGITIRDDRKEKYDFTSPYFEATQLILVPQESNIKSANDLKGKNIGFQSGTTGETAAQNIFGKDYKGLKGYPDLPTAVNDLFTGRIAAVIGDNAVVAEFVKKNPDKKLQLIKDDAFEKEYYGFIVKKGNKELLDKLESGLKKIKEDGTYQKIYNQYFAN